MTTTASILALLNTDTGLCIVPSVYAGGGLMMGDCAAAIALQYSMNTNSNYGFMNFMQYSTPGTCCNYNMNVGGGVCGGYIQP